jgi:hypothetical protein
VKDLTQGSVVSHVLTMAGPISLGIVMALLCQLIDLYFVGGLGDAAIAGVGAADNAGFLINAFTQVLSVGTVALVSHAVGRKDATDANLVFNQALGLSALCGGCALVAGLLLARAYVGSLAADTATVEAGTIYLRWFMPALALQFPLLDIRRPARHRHRSAGDGDPGAHHADQHHPGPDADRRLGYWLRVGCRRRRPCEYACDDPGRSDALDLFSLVEKLSRP